MLLNFKLEGDIMTTIEQTLFYDLVRDGHDYYREAGYERNCGKYLKARNLFGKAKGKFQEAYELSVHTGDTIGQSLGIEIDACSSMYRKMEELIQINERT